VPDTVDVRVYLEDGHRDHPALPLDSRAWAAGERTLVKALPPVFREHLGLDRSHSFTQSYWIAGRSAG
jgi:NADPH-dependent ferric siderophore reductase